MSASPAAARSRRRSLSEALARFGTIATEVGRQTGAPAEVGEGVGDEATARYDADASRAALGEFSGLERATPGVGRAAGEDEGQPRATGEEMRSSKHTRGTAAVQPPLRTQGDGRCPAERERESLDTTHA